MSRENNRTVGWCKCLLILKKNPFLDGNAVGRSTEPVHRDQLRWLIHLAKKRLVSRFLQPRLAATKSA